jgi:hypothetical protein
MYSHTLPAVEILDNFEECNTTLIFLESALRCLTRSGNLNEDHVGDGLAMTMQILIGEYQKLKNDIQNCLNSVVVSTFDVAPFHDDEKT